MKPRNLRITKMKTNSNSKNMASTASNPNLQCASSSSNSNNQLTLIQTQAPTMHSSSHSSTSVTNVSTYSSTAQAKDALITKQSMSVSMTSLPSPQHNIHHGSTTFATLLQQSTDMGGGATGNEFLSPNKVVIDRTYNSLKKKRDVEIEAWRRSWGSGHSHSSCSLQSSATNATGSGTGKDDFWAALQTNYNFIMDTHLLESCKEARGEIEGNIIPNVQDTDCCKKLKNQSSRSHGPGLSDPRRLRRWLREMESRMEKVPTLSEGRKLKTSEIQKLLRDHTELHREIVSQARAVAASIRASEKELNKNLSHSSSSTSGSVEIEGENSSPSTSSKREEPAINGLERRYHLLYLKAIEVQCLLENLLERRHSPSPSISSSSSADDEPAPKHVRLSSGTDKFSLGFLDNQSDDDWIALRRKNVLTDVSNTDAFEADSEGSDNDQMLKIAISSTASTNSDGPPTILSPHMKFSSDKMDKNLNTENINKDDLDLSFGASTTTSVTHTTTVSSPHFDSPKLCTVKKRPKKTDPSKFNRSNRKSKNCGTFYFKHADTDNEGNLTNVTTDAGDTGTEDEQWIFTSSGNVDEENNPIDEDMEDDAEGVPKFKRHLSFTDDGIIESSTETHSNLMEVATSTVTGAITETNTVQESGHTSKISYICVTKATKESIQKLVLGAESLVRDEVILKAQGLQVSSCSRMSHATSTIHKSELLQSPKIKRVQEWLEHQPMTVSGNLLPVTGLLSTDCEASGEASDTDDDVRQEDSDTSNSLGVTDSQVTFMRHDSQATSVENCLGASSGDLLGSSGKETGSSNNTTKSQTIELRMNTKRASNRPWSVSCISQLESSAPLASSNQDSNFSISESALDTISLPNMPAGGVKSEESTPVHKRNLRKRRIRNRKRAVRKLDANIAMQIALGNRVNIERQATIDVHENIVIQSIDLSSADTQKEDEEEALDVVKPDFKIGSVTKVYAQTLGPLAALSRYNFEESAYKASPDMPDSSQRSGTEELSSFEQMWDNYQEKYMSEPYSEDRDTEAAKRLLEFGDDYRNFLDSQSDACSSLSAAQGLDSISPPRHRRFIGGTHTPSDIADSSLEVKKRRLLELSEFEKRRKNLSKINDEEHKSLEIDPIVERDPQDLFKTSHTKTSPDKSRKESDSSVRRRSLRQRKSASSSSGESDSDNDQDICNLLSQSRSRVENVEALRVRHHLLRPEDYAEIIATCQENIQCLETVLRGPNTGGHHVLSTVRTQQARELLSIWESLLDWSENTSVIRQLQEEIDVLKGSLLRLGTQSYSFDSEESIEQAITDLKNERTRLTYYRSKMLKINAAVQRWITHQESRLAKEKEIQQRMGGEQKNEKPKNVLLADDPEFHEQLKESVSEMYGIWDQTDVRLSGRLEDLESALQTWQQFESGLNELKETLDKDRGAIFGFKGALEAGSAIPSEFVSNAEAIAKLLQVNPDNDLKDLLSENPLLPPAILQYGIRPPSAGCSSDSGISDDGGLSERERRLGTLRRLAKQLESDLTPGSDALKTIADRMRAAEAELRTLQETCRDLILKTTASHNQFIESMNKNARSPINVQIPIIAIGKQKAGKGKKKGKKRSPQNSLITGTDLEVEELTDETDAVVVPAVVEAPQTSCWWRFFRYAIPIQLAFLALFLALYGLEPHSCDRMNNFQNSFNPQLRYVRGPPPI